VKGIPKMKLGLFELTVFLTDDAFELEVFAGQDRDQVDSAQDRFRIVQTTRNDIVREILLKLERALAGNATSIEVNVQGDRGIIRDSTFPLPAFAVVAAPAAVSTRRSRGIVPATAKAAEPAAAPGTPRPKRARAGQSRAAKVKAAKQPAAKAEHAGKKTKKTAADQPGTKKKSRKAAGKTVSKKRKPKSDGA
jgi:hypothetical protein